MRSKRFDLSVLTFCCFAVLVSPVKAQEWRSLRTEQACDKVWRTTSYSEVVLERKYAGNYLTNYVVTITSLQPLPKGFAQAGQMLSAKPLESSFPGHDLEAKVDISSNFGLPGESRLLPQIRLTGDGKMLDWLADSSPSFNYFEDGRLVSKLKADGLAQARDILAACKPSAPPPNRKPLLLSRSLQRLDPTQYAPFGEKRGFIGPFKAEVIVDAQGRVASCKTIRSSGVAQADKKFCDDLIRVVRFRPATDALGNATAAKDVVEIKGFNFNP